MAARHMVALFVGLCALGLLGAGCSNPLKQEVAGSLAETALQKVTGGRVGMEAGGGQVTFTDKQTGTGYSLGENIRIPADFPKELMVYPGSTVLALTTGAEATLNLKVEASSDAAVTWYADQFKAAGWKESSKMAAGGYEGREYVKGETKVSVTFLGSRDEGSNATVISLSRKPIKK